MTDIGYRRADPSIESIDDEKNICGIRYVLVKWKNQPPFASSWEPLDGLRKALNHHAALDAHGLLLDERLCRDLKRSQYTTPAGKTSAKVRRNEKSTRSKRKAATSKKFPPGSPSEPLFDEESTSINDCRGLLENSREGLRSPIKEKEELKFTTYVTSKNRLTTHFYKDLVEYYKKCEGDSPPSPVVLSKRKLSLEICSPAKVQESIIEPETGNTGCNQEILKAKEASNKEINKEKSPNSENKTNQEIQVTINFSKEPEREFTQEQPSSKFQSETTLLVSKFEKFLKSKNQSTEMGEIPLFSEVLARAKAKLEAQKESKLSEVPNIFGKFEDRNGIANDNEEEYKNNPFTKVPSKAIPDLSKKLSSQIPVYSPPPVLPASKPLFIPNQPTQTLADTIKKLFPSH